MDSMRTRYNIRFNLCTSDSFNHPIWKCICMLPSCNCMGSSSCCTQLCLLWKMSKRNSKKASSAMQQSHGLFGLWPVIPNLGLPWVQLILQGLLQSFFLLLLAAPLCCQLRQLPIFVSWNVTKLSREFLSRQAWWLGGLVVLMDFEFNSAFVKTPSYPNAKATQRGSDFGPIPTWCIHWESLACSPLLVARQMKVSKIV